jgi:hypothetical protein
MALSLHLLYPELLLHSLLFLLRIIEHLGIVSLQLSDITTINIVGFQLDKFYCDIKRLGCRYPDLIKHPSPGHIPDKGTYMDETMEKLPSTLTSTGIRCFRKKCSGIISSAVDLDNNEIH